MATIYLSQLPAPNVIESLDFETLFAQRKESLIALYPPEQREALRRTLRYESEPLVKLLQENTYRELLLRQRINEAAQANMLGYATGTATSISWGATITSNAWLSRRRMTPDFRPRRR